MHLPRWFSRNPSPRPGRFAAGSASHHLGPAPVVMPAPPADPGRASGGVAAPAPAHGVRSGPCPTLPRCPGTVVVHQDLAVTCTSAFCARTMARDTWYAMHATFVRCTDAKGGSGCPLCGFRHVVVSGAPGATADTTGAS